MINLQKVGVDWNSRSILSQTIQFAFIVFPHARQKYDLQRYEFSDQIFRQVNRTICPASSQSDQAIILKFIEVISKVFI